MTKFFRKKLKNGVIVLMEKRELPLVSFSVTNKFGAAFEESKIKGIAHVIEHLLFTGTKNRTNEEISREIEKKGGVLNAFTSHEVTSYWFKLPSEHLFLGMDIITDMLKNPKFDGEKFEKEKKVILEEIKMYHDNPGTAVFEQIEKNLYENPFGELIIGNKESVSALKRDFVASYFEEVYNPMNYIISIVGNADFEEVCEYFENNFEANEKKSKIKKIIRKNLETVEERENIDQAHFVFAVHAPLPDTDDFIAMDVLDSYLASGMSSRLFLEIREKRGLAYAVKSSLEAEKNYSHYLIYVGTTKEALPEVKKIILKEFVKVENMTEKDLEEAKERTIGLRKVSSEESSDVMRALIYAELLGDAKDYYRYEEKVRAVALEQVKRLGKINGFSTAAIVPKYNKG